MLHIPLFCVATLMAASACQAASDLKLVNPLFAPDLGSWKESNKQQVSYASGRLKIIDNDPLVSFAAESELKLVKPGTQIDASAMVVVESSTDSGGVNLGIRFYDKDERLIDATKLKSFSAPLNEPLLTVVSAIVPANAKFATVYPSSGTAAKSVAYFDNVTFTVAEIKDLKHQLTAPHVSVAAFDSNTMYVAASGAPARLAIYNVSDRHRRSVLDFPREIDQAESEDILSITVAADSSVYMGSGSGRLYRYDPSAALPKISQVHRFKVDKDTMVWSLKPGPKPSIFGGLSFTGNSFKAFRYTPGQNPDATTYALASPTEAINYVHALAVDPNGKLLWGTGTPAALYRTDLDGKNGSRVFMDSTLSNVYSTDYVGGHIFVRMVNNDHNRTYVLDQQYQKVATIEDINSLGVSPIAPGTTKVFYTKQRALDEASYLYSFDLADVTKPEVELVPMSQSAAFAFDATGTYLIAALRDGNIARHPVDPKYPAVLTMPFLRPDTSADIRTLTNGGGKIFTSGFGVGGLAVYDPVSSTPPVRTVESLQGEGLALLGNKLYAGLYPGGVVKSFDVIAGRLANATDLLFPKRYGQDRPFAMLAIGAPVNRLVVGTVPTKYGEGALAILPLDNPNAQWDVKSPYIGGQTVMTLTNIGSVVYGGTSTWGAQGEKPADREEAKLFSFDLNKPGAETSFSPVPNKQIITTVLNVQGKIWGLADDTLFIYTPGQNVDDIITKRFEPNFSYGAWGIVWNAARMVEAKNGYVYISVLKSLYRVPTKPPYEIEKVISSTIDNEVDLVTVDDHGDLYYKSGARLKKLDMVAP